MNLLNLWPIISLSFLPVVHGTQFVPLTIEEQVRDADFAVEARLKSSHVFKSKNSLIMSRYNFLVEESFGFNESELTLEMPGGTLEGISTQIDGAPQFEMNQKVFLLLKKIESKIYLSNFTLGEYKIITIDEKKYYRSSVFPYHPQIGLISKEKMKNLLSQKNFFVLKQSSPINSLTQLASQKYAAEKKITKIEKKRAPANEERSYFSLIVGGGFAILILIIAVFMRKIKKP